jgi:hypothetical protein
MAFVLVYSKTTGRKQTVPEHWLGHPVLGQDFRKTPLSEKQQRHTDTPTDGDKE